MAEVVENEKIERTLHEIATVLELRGAINVQLRFDREGPKVFEINPRFSSTVGFRHALGFRDFVWALLESRGMSVESYCPPKVGTRIFRGSYPIVLR